MKRFCRNVGREYMMFVEPVNICWAYLFNREWCDSSGETLGAIILLSALIPITPLVDLCGAPLWALLLGAREEGE